MPKQVFVFPKVTDRKQVFEALDGSVELKDRMVAEVTPLIKQLRGQVVDDDFLFMFDLVLHEIVVNLFAHDALDVHGAEWKSFVEGAELPDQMSRFSDAKGRQNSLEVRVSDDTIEVTVVLSRPYETFPAKWAESKNYAPSDEQLLDPSGRGHRLIAAFFDNATYQPDTRTITFTRSRKAAGEGAAVADEVLSGKC